MSNERLKIKFAIVLPIAQLVAAVIMLRMGHRVELVKQRLYDTSYTSTINSICVGINAPAILFRPVGRIVIPLMIILPDSWIEGLPSIGYRIDSIPFLIGVIVVWYLIGRTLDRRRSARALAVTPKLTASLFRKTILILAGGFLLFMAARFLGNPGMFCNPSGTTAEALLYLVWSAALIILPVISIVNEIRRRRSTRATLAP
jgi:hypothetical protein